MKQNITVKQVNELSAEGLERLKKWWKPKPGDHCTALVHFSSKKRDYGLGIYKYENAAGKFIDFHKPYVAGYKKKVSPLLSIGQMIEFLGDGWMVGLENAKGYVKVKPFDLCNFLWEDAKRELENENNL